jgi:hypothetical protein
MKKRNFFKLGAFQFLVLKTRPRSGVGFRIRSTSVIRYTVGMDEGYGNRKDPYLFFDENHPTSFLNPATFAAAKQW